MQRRQFEQELAEARRVTEKLVVLIVQHLESQEGLLKVVAMEGGAELREGLAMSLRQTWEHLGLLGVSLDGEVGEPLDLNRHRVLRQAAERTTDVDRVVKVVGRGLMFKGRRLRAAEVEVARGGGAS